MGQGALTAAGFSLAAYAAARFGKAGTAKSLFLLAFLVGFGVTWRGLLTLRRSASLANQVPARSVGE